MNEKKAVPKLIDLHSHILPAIDDGSQDVAESLALLKQLQEQNVVCVAATPHFYADKTNIKEFFRLRAHSAKKLREAIPENMPEIRLGAEVTYFDGIGHADAVRQLTLEGTPLLLVEMPFVPWSEKMLNDLITLSGSGHISVLLAHIERYLPFQKASTWTFLLQHDIYMQSNADFFLSSYGRRHGANMLLLGRIHVFGSDCHNLHTRPPRMAEAAAQILKSDGSAAFAPIRSFYRDFFPDIEVSP